MRSKIAKKIISETSEEKKEKVRNNANNLINKKMEKVTKSVIKLSEIPENLQRNEIFIGHKIHTYAIFHIDESEEDELSFWLIKNYPTIKRKRSFLIHIDKKIKDVLPDGVLWEKSKEYSKQFAIRDKPVQSEIAMNEAQDHYYRGMIASRDMLS